jgi:predicted ATPase
MLKNERPSFLEINQLKHEFEINKKIESDGVLKEYGIESYRDRMALILEDFGGENLKNSQIFHQFDIKIFLKIAIRLTEILGNIHYKNIIFNNLNPTNILINYRTNVIKFTDFGIASLLSRDSQELISPEKLEVSLPYISPEQTGRMNRSIDYRTDLYSLGVMFYEMLTGTLPFQSLDPLELIHSHMAKIAANPHTLNPRIPLVLSLIIMKLLAKNAEDRYQGAYGLKADLAECLAQMEQNGRIEEFPIAQKDISEKLQIPQKLYGREKEISEMLEGFRRVRNGKTEMMVVSGYSGIGKTVLIKELYKPITETRGYFLSGKFDQYLRNIPYSAIIYALQGMIRMLLSESNEKVLQWKNKILNSCNTNGQILMDVIPELEYIIGRQPSVPELPPAESQNRFNMVFRDFIKIFTQKDHPLCIFLDDLQWADLASILLIKSLVTDTESGYLYILGAYRDNKVDGSHPLIMMLEEIKKGGFEIQNIKLQPLNLTQVNEMNANTLKSDLAKTESLSQLVYQKTMGNPFFVSEFLKTLYQEDLLQFDFKSGSWIWNLSSIRQKDITDNVVDMLLGKIGLLKPETQNILKLAACIGNTFNLRILALINQKSVFQTLVDLWEALKQGIILSQSDISRFMHKTENIQNREEEEILGKINASFIHDRLHEAVYSIPAGEEKKKIHHQIGNRLLEKCDESEKEKLLFDIVNHLNIGRNSNMGEKEELELFSLNLTAAQKAKSSMAYGNSAEFLNIALELLPSDAWHKHYSMALSMYEELTEINFLLGNPEKVEEFSERVKNNTRDILDLVQTYKILITFYASINKLEKALDISVEIMGKLGLKVPRHPHQLDIVKWLIKSKLAIGRKNFMDLGKIDLIKDRRVSSILTIADIAAGAAYIGEPKLLPILVFLMVFLSVKNGYNSSSIYSFAVYGLILCGVLGDIKRGYNFGKLSLELIDKYNAKNVAGRTKFINFAFCSHWLEPVKSTLPGFIESAQSCLEVGDLEYFGYSAVYNFVYSLISGQNLIILDKSYSGLENKFSQHNLEISLRALQACGQFIAILKGETNEKNKLSGERFNEDILVPRMMANKLYAALFQFYSYKIILLYLFENYEKAYSELKASAPFYETGAGHALIPKQHFFSALLNIALYRLGSGKKKKTHLKEAKSHLKKIKKWARFSPENREHEVAIIEAEIFSVLNKKAQAISLYNEGIQKARKNGFIQDEALANELSAKFFLSLHDMEKAEDYMIKAMGCYISWGAKGKVIDLEEKYYFLLK